jgi:hypothetical protein
MTTEGAVLVLVDAIVAPGYTLSWLPDVATYCGSVGHVNEVFRQRTNWMSCVPVRCLK